MKIIENRCFGEVKTSKIVSGETNYGGFLLI